MNKLNIITSKTQYPNVKKFETNRFLVQNGKYKFSDKNEALSSPLAQKFFSSPCIRTIFIAENFVAIEISQNSSWEEVENEILQTLEDHLASGEKAVLNEPKFFPAEVYTEMDIGPGTLKFVCNKKLVLEKIRFDFNQDYEISPLAKALFQFDYVKRVEFDNNAIIITKGGSVQWDEITMELREFIRNYIREGREVLGE